MYINTVILYGNLTRDPELRALPSGMNVCSFSIATNRTFTGKDGKKQEQTDFHNVVVFGRQADNVAQYMKKEAAYSSKGASRPAHGRKTVRSSTAPKSSRIASNSGRVSAGELAANVRHRRLAARIATRASLHLLVLASITRRMTSTRKTSRSRRMTGFRI